MTCNNALLSNLRYDARVIFGNGFGMKHPILCGLLVAALSLSACDGTPQHPDNLPWQIHITEQGNPQVFHLNLGQTTLKQTIEQFHSFPELALFAHESGKRSLEAYFGKLRLGVFEAKIIAELPADAPLLDQLQKNASKKEGMASGMWKYTIAESDYTVLNALPVKKLVYMPVANYTPDIIQQRFGYPPERLASKQAQVDYWCYADKSLIIAVDKEEGAVFYYTTQANYPALKQELLEAKPQND